MTVKDVEKRRDALSMLKTDEHGIIVKQEVICPTCGLTGWISAMAPTPIYDLLMWRCYWCGQSSDWLRWVSKD